MRVDIALLLGSLLFAVPSVVSATEPDSYPRDLFGEAPEGSEEKVVPRWSLQYRPRAESSANGPIRFDPLNDNTSFSQRARINTEVWYRSVRLKIGFQNSLTAQTELANASVEAFEAYVEMGRGPLRLRVGPQMITFATGRVLTAPIWSQAGRTINAIRAVYREGPWMGDLFVGRHNGSGVLRDLVGANVVRRLGRFRLGLETLVETNEWLGADSRQGLAGGYRRTTAGAHLSLRDPFILNAEVLVQRGRFDGDGSAIFYGNAGGDIRGYLASVQAGKTFGDWLTAVLFMDVVSGDSDQTDNRFGTFDTVLGYRRRWYGRADRFIQLARDTRQGGLINTGVRTQSDLGVGTLFTEWHYHHIPETDLDGNQGPAGAEIDLRYVYPLADGVRLSVAYFGFLRLGDFRDVPGSDTPRNVKLKNYGYIQLDVNFEAL